MRILRDILRVISTPSAKNVNLSGPCQNLNRHIVMREIPPFLSRVHIPPKMPKGDLSGRFDPLANTKQAAWQLNDGQNNFVTKYFSHWLGGSIIQDSILEDCPIPDHSLLKPAKLDPDMVAILPSLARAPAKQVDVGFLLQKAQESAK